MSEILFLFLIFVNLLFFLYLVGKPRNITAMPYLLSLAVIGFIIPQLVYLRSHDGLTEPGMTSFLTMVIGAQLATALGWRVGHRTTNGNFNPRAGNKTTLIQVRPLAILAVILFTTGIVFTLWLRSLSPQLLMGSQWTGLPVTLNFFASALKYSFVFSLALYLQTRQKLFLFLTVIAAIPIADRALILFRREDIVTVAVGVSLCLAVYRRRHVPRYLLIPALVIGIAMINNAGAYRSSTFSYSDEGRSVSIEGYISRVFDFSGLVKFAEGEAEISAHSTTAPEVQNAVSLIAASDYYNFRLWGSTVFNKVIQDFVPGGFSILGLTKDSLFIGGARDLLKAYRSGPTGATSTGFAEAYINFGWLGSLCFFAIAAVLRRAYSLSLAGSPVAVLIYTSACVEAMKIATHSLGGFFSECVYLMILLSPLLFFKFRPLAHMRKVPHANSIKDRTATPSRVRHSRIPPRPTGG